MVRRISGKPVIKFHFLTDGSSVGARLRVKLNHLDLRSGIVVFATNYWEKDVLSRLSEVGLKIASLPKTIAQVDRECDVLDRDYRAGRDPVQGYSQLQISSFLTAMQGATKKASMLRDELTASVAELATIEERMATAHCIRDLLNGAIPLEESTDGREYALCQKILWSSMHKLTPQQWNTLVTGQLGREAAQLALALGGDTATSGRDRISSEVRRAVWIRDGGSCARCRSRERLEYDHIIAVSLGGSNTERNIELLCEACNRSKSNKVQ